MMARIYTKRGDEGKTSLYGGTRVSKDDLFVEALGSLDEANTSIGLALSGITDEDVRESLQSVQHTLFEIGSEVAQGKSADFALADETDPPTVARLEQWIDTFDAALPRLTGFILPGGSTSGARLHVARAVSRRAERAVVRLSRNESVNPVALMYLNRLSDLLYVLARTVNHRACVQEESWRKQR